MYKIAFICFPDFQSLDLIGPMEVFSGLNQEGKKKYELSILSEFGGNITSSSGLSIQTIVLKNLKGYDSLIIVGGKGAKNASQNPILVSYIQQESKNVRRLVSICTGSFILAATGLLDGKKATTHWRLLKQLQSIYPKIKVDDNAIYVNDGDIYTSAGVSAGIDLTLTLIADDYGKALSRDVAKELVVYYHRPGGQKQFSNYLKMQSVENVKLQKVCTYIFNNPQEDLTILKLASISNMSPRNFSRKFTQELQLTPGKYVEETRLEKAKLLLEQNQLPLSKIATEVGISSSDVLCRLFKKHFNVSTSEYKKHFYGG